MDWCLYDNMIGVQSVWSNFESVKSVFEACKFEFNFEWNKGYNKGWLKNSYLSDLTFILDDLKFIGKLFQRSTTSMLMISSNSNDFKGKLRFEVG